MASTDSYAGDYGNPWATMDDFSFGQDFDLGIDWNSFGNPTYDGGTLDTFNVNTTPDDFDPIGQVIDGWVPNHGGSFLDDIYGPDGIGDPLGELGAVYIPDTATNPTPTQQNPATRPPTTARPPGSIASPSGATSSPRPSQSSGNAAQDIAKLVNSILQAFKPAQTTNPQGQPVSQPAPAGGGFDFSSLILIGAGAGVAWLILRKK